MIPLITVTLSGNLPSPNPRGSTIVSSAIETATPGHGAEVPDNGTTPIVIVTGSAGGNRVVWTSVTAVAVLFLGVFWLEE